MTEREFVERTAPLVLIASWAGKVRCRDDEGGTHAAGVVAFARELWRAIENEFEEKATGVGR